jgi:response regulator of citrate/malate metabolism
VVTSDDQPETAKRARDAGVSAMMIKPVTYEMLEATLKEVNLL